MVAHIQLAHQIQHHHTPGILAGVVGTPVGGTLPGVDSRLVDSHLVDTRPAEAGNLPVGIQLEDIRLVADNRLDFDTLCCNWVVLWT